MFPNISYLIEYFIGYRPWFLAFIQTFGFFFGLSFLAAFYFIQFELKRYENEGKLFPIVKKVNIKDNRVQNAIINAIVYGILFYKLAYIIPNFSTFTEAPQDFILSKEGNILGFILGICISGYEYFSSRKLVVKTGLIEQKTHPYELSVNFIMIAAITGILGAKMFHNFEYWNEFLRNPIEQLLSFSGLTFYGGLICAAIAVIYYARKNNIDLKIMADTVAPALMLAYGIGRMGCHLSGDGDWGISNRYPKPFSWLPDWLWAYKYPHNVIEDGIQMMNCTGKYCMELAEPAWPTPLYESIICITFFAILWVLRKKLNKIASGLVMAVYLLLNGIERYSIEQVRINPLMGNTGMSQAMIIALALIVLGIILGIIFYKQRNKP